MESIISPSNRCLLIAAAPKEADAVLQGFGKDLDARSLSGDPVRLDECFDLIMGGVGKSSASASTARALTLHQYAVVISVGIAGALPGEDALRLGQSVCATRSVFSDEGVGAPDGFIPLSEMGFAPFDQDQMGKDHDPDLTSALSALTDTSGIIATVSWCSGDDGCAKGVVARTGAIAEAMEGAAVCVGVQTVDRSILTGEIRVISNTTGNRDQQVWDLDRSLSCLVELMGNLRVLGRG